MLTHIPHRALGLNPLCPLGWLSLHEYTIGQLSTILYGISYIEFIDYLIISFLSFIVEGLD
jgi:hypothetical protein